MAHDLDDEELKTTRILHGVDKEDEEKKAIERLDYFEPDDLVECAIYRDCVETIKKLIEKQQKEIEELKEKDTANLAYYDQIYRNGIYTGQKAVEEKIKAKIIEIKDKPVKDEFITASQGKLNTIIEIESLLEKE